jgi:hypothetical protein
VRICFLRSSSASGRPSGVRQESPVIHYTLPKPYSSFFLADSHLFLRSSPGAARFRSDLSQGEGGPHVLESETVKRRKDTAGCLQRRLIPIDRSKQRRGRDVTTLDIRGGLTSTLSSAVDKEPRSSTSCCDYWIYLAEGVGFEPMVVPARLRIRQ